MNFRKSVAVLFTLSLLASCAAPQKGEEAASNRKIVKTDKAPLPVGPYSQAILVGNTLYAAGQIGIDPEAKKLVEGIEAQTTQVMSNLGAVLEAEGFTYANTVSCTIYLTDLANYGKVNELYGSYFTEGAPARATVQVDSLPGNALIEIALTAAR
ncbi:Rid family detoxifying hydrolase [Flammeovirgaceae bacterium SG7u.111]|nr:Rid family detoxifying hydrolase [Flammeovirgaceae bacterium SG7u.132]WPO37478.1 Rid family detoxifying hydrolase [Flammeovirgaceae bacterium SG7u.111]